MLTAFEVYSQLKERGLDITRDEVKTAYNSLDLDKIKSDAEARVKVEEWKGEAINAVTDPKEHWPILKQEGAKAIKVWIDGKLIRFEYADWHTGGPITADSLSSLMAEIHDTTVDDLANQAVVQAVIKAL